MTAEAPGAEHQLDQAISVLGTEAMQGSQRRIYFDDLAGWLKLDIERDEAGQIVSATRDGSPIPTKTAVRIENQLKRARLFYDPEERVFRGLGLDSINKGDLSRAITARAEEIVASGELESLLAARMNETAEEPVETPA